MRMGLKLNCWVAKIFPTFSQTFEKLNSVEGTTAVGYCK